MSTLIFNVKSLYVDTYPIGEIENADPDSVSVLINRVSDQLQSGEIELFPVTQLEAYEAKARLDRVRKRRQEHRQNNLEQMREYERNRNRNKPLSK